MKTYVFYQKNTNIEVVLSAMSFSEAEDALDAVVKDINSWICRDEEGEDEE